jgi:hypothetical protein
MPKATTAYEEFIECAHLLRHHAMIQTARERIARATAEDAGTS